MHVLMILSQLLEDLSKIQKEILEVCLTAFGEFTLSQERDFSL